SAAVGGGIPALTRRWPSVQAEVERSFEIVLGVGLERNVGLGRFHAGDLADLVRDDPGELLVLAHAHNGDEIDVAGDRVHLAHAVDLSHALRDLWDLVGFVINKLYSR